MKIRPILAAGVVIALVAVVVVLNRRDDLSRATVRKAQPEAVAPGSPFDAVSASAIPPARADLDGQPAMTAPEQTELSTTERSPLADLLGAPTTKPDVEPRIVLDVLNAYRRAFGVYPAGEDNRQFVNALLGANRDKLPFLPRDHPRLNARGELVDAWGTPFFFHLNSRTSIEVRSAGADRLLFTADDFVAGKAPRVDGPSSASEDESLGQ